MKDKEAAEAFGRYWKRHGRYWGEEDGDRVRPILEPAIKEAFFSGVRVANYHKADKSARMGGKDE